MFSFITKRISRESLAYDPQKIMKKYEHASHDECTLNRTYKNSFL